MKEELEQYLDILKGAELCARLGDDELRSVLERTRAEAVSFERGETIYHYGDSVERTGIVLEGTVIVDANNVDGERTNLNMLRQGEEFGSYLVVSGVRRSPMRIYAGSRCKVVFLDIEKLAQDQEKAPEIWILMDNLLRSFSDRLVDQYLRLHIYGQKRVRSRIRMYLLSLKRTGDEVTIPMNRTALAAYLGVDRTALARELGRMADEGVIEVRKRRVRLLDEDFFGTGAR